MANIEHVIKFLEKNNLTLVTAESCTAGLAASLLADVPGCASVLECGYIMYSEQAKCNYLNVDPQIIAAYGLTSEEVAREMAVGALECTRATISLAITGTAESDDELNGVVCFGYAIDADEPFALSETVRFIGSRNEVRQAAAEHSILQLPNYYKRLMERLNNP